MFFAASVHAAIFTLTKATIDSVPWAGVVDFSKPTLGAGAGLVTNTVLPGDTIQIESHTRTTLTLMNLVGTATQKITVTNVPGGQFIIGDVTVGGTTTPGLALQLWGVQHVILKGTPTSGGAYGITIAHATGAHGIKIDYNHGNEVRFAHTPTGSLDVEVTGVEIGNTAFDAIQAKCELALSSLPAGYVMDSISIHNNYIHDTGGEGMYLGWTTAGDHENMSNVTVHDNSLVRTGWDGIQLNCATTGTNLIYNNTILGYGLTSNTFSPFYYQNGGLSIGSSKVKIYDNLIEMVSGTGSQYQGTGMNFFLYDHCQIYNNVIIMGHYGSTAPPDGIYLNQGDAASFRPPPPGTVLDLINNTIITPDRCGLAIGLKVTNPVNFYNNIVAAPANLSLAPGPLVYISIEGGSGVTLNQSNNLLRPTVAEINFVNPSGANYELTASSPAVDAGTNVASYGITTDIDGVARPQGSAYDEGAYEFFASIGVITPVAFGTATGSLACTAVGAFDAQPTWDSVNHKPVGDDPSPYSTTGTALANRVWFVDFGTNWAKVRLTGTWTRYRPFSGGTYTGFTTVWWDNDNDNVNDGITVTSTINFATAVSLPNVGNQQWVQDKDLSASPVTPQGRYLLFATGPAPTDRPNEFAFIGYTVP